MNSIERNSLTGQVGIVKLTVVTIGLIMLSGCSIFHNGEPPASMALPQTIHVEVTTVVKNKIADPLVVPAEIAPSVSIDVVAPTGGEFDQLLVKRGDFVQMGETIIKLKSVEVQTERDRAQLAVKAAQDNLAQAKQKDSKDRLDRQAQLSDARHKAEQTLTDLTRSYNKIRNDFDDGLATKDQVEQADAARNNAQRMVDQLAGEQQSSGSSTSLTGLELDLQNAQITLQRSDQALASLEVKAPVRGVLTNLTTVEPGMKLQAGAKIGVIQKLDPIRILAQLSQEYVKLLNGKKTLGFSVAGLAKPVQGEIRYLSEVADPQTGLFELDLEAGNSDVVIKPGMRAEIELSSEQDTMALTVPTYSIIREGADAFVFVIENGEVEKRKVQLGRLNEPNQEVLSGVKEGERVVTSGLSQLKDKDHVQVDNG